LHVSLIQNPSHLESSNSVAMGKVKAKQTIKQDAKGDKTLCLMLHGDAAFYAQGIVTESIAISRLEAFDTGDRQKSFLWKLRFHICYRYLFIHLYGHH